MTDSDAKRRRILRVAETLFCDQGVERTSLRQVGKGAGAAVGSITHFFGKKPELAAAVLDHMVDRLAADAERALNGHDTTLEADIRSVLSACLKWPRSFPHYRQLISALDAYVTAEGQGTRGRLQDRLANVLARWADRRGPKTVIRLSGNQLYAVVMAPAMCRADPQAQWLEILTAAALAAIKPQNGAAR